jgi:hypothetical protein
MESGSHRAPKIRLSINFGLGDAKFPAEKAANSPHSALHNGTLTKAGK